MMMSKLNAMKREIVDEMGAGQTTARALPPKTKIVKTATACCSLLTFSVF